MYEDRLLFPLLVTIEGFLRKKTLQELLSCEMVETATFAYYVVFSSPISTVDTHSS